MMSFRLDGTIGCCAPKRYANVGSLELSSRVTISGPGDVTEEIVRISLVWVPDSSVEFRIFGELFHCGLGLLDGCYTKIHRGELNWLTNWRPSLNF